MTDMQLVRLAQCKGFAVFWNCGRYYWAPDAGVTWPPRETWSTPYPDLASAALAALAQDR